MFQENRLKKHCISNKILIARYVVYIFVRRVRNSILHQKIKEIKEITMGNGTKGTETAVNILALAFMLAVIFFSVINSIEKAERESRHGRTQNLSLVQTISTLQVCNKNNSRYPDIQKEF
jgi:hypothetical protein